MLRKLLFCACLMMVVTVAKSQVYVDGQNINADTSVNYVEIAYQAYHWGFGIRQVDIGKKKTRQLTDAAGKPFYPNSAVDLLQFMKRNGWIMIRRDLIFEAPAASSSIGVALAFVLFERANTVPAH